MLSWRRVKFGFREIGSGGVMRIMVDWVWNLGILEELGELGHSL